MNINLRQLEALCAVIEQRSFSKAAEQLFLSQSTVSSHIAQLERTLQTPLLIRADKKHVAPTEAGLSAYAHAQDILRACRALEAEFQEEHASHAGPITIAASTVPSRYLLPQLLAAYVRKRPSTRLSILKGDSEYALQKLETREAQIAFVGTKLKEQSYHYDVLCRDNIVMITPNTPEFRSLQQAGAWGRQLLHYPIIMREPGSGTKKEVDKYLESIGVDHKSLRIVAHMNDLEMVKQSVVNGLGVSILSEWVAEEEIKNAAVLRFRLDATEFHREIYLAYHKRRHFSADERAFISFVKRYFAKSCAD